MNHSVSDRLLTSCKDCGASISIYRKDQLCDNCRMKNKYSGRYTEDYIKCPYCNHRYFILYNEHLQKHGKSMKDLYEEFGKDYPTCSKKYAVRNHSNYQHGELVPVLFKEKTIYLKSKWEHEIFNQLVDCGYMFEYESLKISYKYNDRTHYYLPDFYLPDFNLILEVKPEFARNDDRNIQKEQAAIQQGYRFEYMTNNSNISEVLHKHMRP